MVVIGYGQIFFIDETTVSVNVLICPGHSYL